MNFTAFIDESGTHGRDPTIIMGAFLGHAYQWKIFSRDLDRIRKFYGFDIFHAKDFKALRGEFENWSEEKCLRLIDDLIALVRDRLTSGVTIPLERSRHLNEYRNTPFPPKMQPDSQFGLCFRGLLAHLIAKVAPIGKRPILHIVVEAGHRNVGATPNIFKEFKKRLRRNGVDLLGTITIAKKQESKELMLADFLAHSHSDMRARSPIPLDYRALVRPPTPNQAGLTFLEFFKDGSGFASMKQQFVQDKGEQIAEWRKRRALKIGAATQPAHASVSKPQG